MYSHTIDYLRRVYESDLSNAQRSILTALALHEETASDGVCWLTGKELARRANCTPRTLRTYRAGLEEQGWFATLQDDEGNTGYMLNRSADLRSATDPLCSGSQILPGNKILPHRKPFPPQPDLRSAPETTSAPSVQYPDLISAWSECGHPVEYAGDFDYLAGLSMYWHEQCYTQARPASPSFIDVFEQEADQEAARSETTDLQNGTRASVGCGPRNKFGGSLADDVTWLADQFDQYNIECGDRNIPAQVRATQRPFDDLDTWQTFIEDKLLDFSERPEPCGSQLVLKSLRADGEGWLAKRKALAAAPSNVINLNQRKAPKYPEQRIEVEPEFKLGGRYHRFKEDLPEREMSDEDKMILKMLSRGGSR